MTWTRTSRALRWAAVGGAAALALTACAGNNADAGGGDATNDPIRIGTSLPLTGEFSEAGQATQRGYETWVKMVNDSGGLLGRQVEIVVKDDATNQNTVVTDYNALISQDKVDLLLGTQSSLLNLPASAVAERNAMLFVEPAGGAPDLFNRGFKYLFFAQQAVSSTQGDVWADWVISLPADQRPTKVAYPVLDDPFAGPVADGIEAKLSAAGIETVYKEVYPATERNFDAIAGAIKDSGADAVVQGSQFEDGVNFIRAMNRAGFAPKWLFQSSSPSYGTQYLEGVGQENTEGVFYATSYNVSANTPGNADFVAAYKQLNGDEPSEDAADGFAAAQVLQAAAEAVGSIDDQSKLADWLRSSTVDTVLGPLHWDENGQPQGQYLIGQWQDGVVQVVLPADAATSDKIIAWGGGDL